VLLETDLDRRRARVERVVDELLERRLERGDDLAGRQPVDRGAIDRLDRHLELVGLEEPSDVKG